MFIHLYFSFFVFLSHTLPRWNHCRLHSVKSIYYDSTDTIFLMSTYSNYNMFSYLLLFLFSSSLSHWLNLLGRYFYCSIDCFRHYQEQFCHCSHLYSTEMIKPLRCFRVVHYYNTSRTYNILFVFFYSYRFLLSYILKSVSSFFGTIIGYKVVSQLIIIWLIQYFLCVSIHTTRHNHTIFCYFFLHRYLPDSTF